MNEENDVVIYEDDEYDIDMSSYDEKTEDVNLNEETENDINNKITYYKKFYNKKSIYSVKSYKKWLYFGSMNNNCYIYNNFDEDLLNFINNENINENITLNKEKIKLKNLKYETFNDTIIDIKFSKSYKYVAVGIYNGLIYVYENNKSIETNILNYNIKNIKLNANESNNFVKIYEWNNIYKNINKYIKMNEGNISNENEKLNEEMKLINILGFNDLDKQKDLSYFMFCPFNENIIFSIYEMSNNIYIWNINELIEKENEINNIYLNPINIIYTYNIPTFFNICNYEQKIYLIVGFNNGESIVYDYFDIYNIQKIKDLKKKKNEIKNKFNIRNNEDIETNSKNIDSNKSNEINDKSVLCIDNNLNNEIYVSTHNNIITINNINNNNIIHNFETLHNNTIECCLFNNKYNQIIASCSLDNFINIFDYQHNKQINKFYVNYNFNEENNQLNNSNNGISLLRWINANLLLFCSLNGNIYIYDTRLRKCIHQFYSHNSVIFNIDVSINLIKNDLTILSIFTASDDASSNIHFLNISNIL